ncbi:MAG: TIM barrel protein [Verrucomicrobia bacterium]|nr:TIM barrel protein [Verrucomicrobiota bacterium]
MTTTPRSRREFLKRGSALAASLGVSVLGAAPAPAGVTLGFSLYGMKPLTLDKALQTCAAIGYDAVEFPLMPGYPTEPKLLTADARRDLARRLAALGLRLGALMENLPLTGDAKSHQQNLDRIKAAAELAHAISPAAPPPLETVLGGRPDQWALLRDGFAERLRGWAEIAAAHKLVVAIKPHVSGAMHLPEHALWLLDQVRSPWIKAAYDFSHYQLRGLALADTLKALLPQSVFIHVKDSEGELGKFKFVLPGEGTIDYRDYFSRLKEAAWTGPVMVEVSSQVFNQAGYDPFLAAKKSYAALAPAMSAAGLRAGGR